MSVPSDFILCEFAIDHRGVGTRTVTGYRFGHFGLHNVVADMFDEVWVVTHLPTGLKIPSCALSIEDAVAFMRELQALRSDWGALSYSSVAEVRDQVAPLMDRHGLQPFSEGTTPQQRRKAAFDRASASA